MLGSADQEDVSFLDFIGEDRLPCRVEIRSPVFSIGRGYDNDLRIEDSHVSRRHVEIVRIEKHRYLLRDKKSKGGSFVNGERIQECELKSGDEIVLGGFTDGKLTFSFSSKSAVTGMLSTIDSLETARQTSDS